MHIKIISESMWEIIAFIYGVLLPIFLCKLTIQNNVV